MTLLGVLLVFFMNYPVTCFFPKPTQWQQDFVLLLAAPASMHSGS